MKEIKRKFLKYKIRNRISTKAKIIIIYLLLFIILLINQNASFNNIKALIIEEYYAQIQKENVYLYEKPFGNPIFEIPITYYVKLIENEAKGYYKAEYMNQIGYVLANEIQCVANPPGTPYLKNISFRNYGAQSSELRSEPSRLGGATTLLYELPLYETNFQYYGKISGEEVVPNRKDIWYYCEYIKNNKVTKGYIYAGLIDMMSEKINNPIDTYPILKHKWQDSEKTNSNINAKISFPKRNEILIILGISIPILLLFALMFKERPTKKESNNPRNNKNIRTNTNRVLLEEPRYPNNSILNETNKNNKQTYFRKINKCKKGKDYYEL